MTALLIYRSISVVASRLWFWISNHHKIEKWTLDLVHMDLGLKHSHMVLVLVSNQQKAWLTGLKVSK